MKTFLNGWRIVLALIFNGKIKIGFRKLLKKNVILKLCFKNYIANEVLLSCSNGKLK